MSNEKLAYLENRVNNYPLIRREQIKILFASDDTLRKLEEDPSLINNEKLFIDSDLTMLGLDELGNIKKCSTADGIEVCKENGILLIEAKDVTNALLQRLNSIINDNEGEVFVEGIVDKRIEEVEKKLNGSINLLNRLLKPINRTLDDNESISIGLFIDYKLTDVDEFGLTGDIGLLRDEIDEYSEMFTDTRIYTNKTLNDMEELIKEYSFEYKNNSLNI